MLMFMSVLFTTLSMFLFFLSMIFLFSNLTTQIYFPMLFLPSSNFSIGMILDWMSLLFSASVLLISSMVMMFSKSYMQEKEHNRFTLILLSFVLSMFIMILSNNIFFIMLGWDGLGISSYILVIFYMNSKSKESGAITILSNRIGDIFIIIAIGLSLFNGIPELLLSKEFSLITILLLTIAAFTKSAQFPFMAWLPAAMAAPTPISALVHSSTLVTAGTYLLIRTFNFPHPMSSFLIMFISLITMTFSSISACWEQDFKKIIALSTLSQMAMIMFAISLNLPLIAFFHLITHAFFKSTMFLCAGAIIHCSNYQDIRSQGTNSNWSPLIMTSLNITSMSLMGLPFLSGFFSKDAILEFSLSNSINTLMFLISAFSVGLTASYSMRMFLSMSNTPNKSNPDKSFHSIFFISIPITMLISFSIWTGLFLSWIILPQQCLLLPPLMKFLIPISIIAGIMMGSMLSFKSKNYMKLSTTMASLWFLNLLSSIPIMNFSFSLSNSYSSNDKSWMENSSAKGSFLMLNKLSPNPDLFLKILLCPIFLFIFISTLFL